MNSDVKMPSHDNLILGHRTVVDYAQQNSRLDGVDDASITIVMRRTALKTISKSKPSSKPVTQFAMRVAMFLLSRG